MARTDEVLAPEDELEIELIVKADRSLICLPFLKVWDAYQRIKRADKLYNDHWKEDKNETEASDDGGFCDGAGI
jgi:hypothetical protein